ncbi:LOW QUALITY PROTEIN: uncharacterized protein Dyak_GE28237 [Drosophila yakuba]|uniref:Uncharacterized protein n=1 Tax=Drosophila yakuba TaxID=7245 RepID=A0A0R1EHT5_DROYA|nr:LOW QUALITY PROTEIN: uncharacterized protein Dyak_GE28237 [Drosophila yakuba]
MENEEREVYKVLRSRTVYYTDPKRRRRNRRAREPVKVHEDPQSDEDPESDEDPSRSLQVCDDSPKTEANNQGRSRLQKISNSQFGIEPISCPLCWHLCRLDFANSNVYDFHFPMAQ